MKVLFFRVRRRRRRGRGRGARNIYNSSSTPFSALSASGRVLLYLYVCSLISFLRGGVIAAAVSYDFERIRSRDERGKLSDATKSLELIEIGRFEVIPTNVLRPRLNFHSILLDFNLYFTIRQKI